MEDSDMKDSEQYQMTSGAVSGDVDAGKCQ